jgi:hypothetical protein
MYGNKLVKLIAMHDDYVKTISFSGAYASLDE